MPGYCIHGLLGHKMRIIMDDHPQGKEVKFKLDSGAEVINGCRPTNLYKSQKYYYGPARQALDVICELSLTSKD